MSDRSQSRAISLTCRCGANLTIEHWDIVDETSRPGLADDLVHGRLGRAKCPECARMSYSEEPVVVVRSVAGHDVALAFADGPAEIEALRHELETAAGDVEVFTLPFEALPVVLARDLNQDAQNLDTAVREVEGHHGQQAAESYRLLVLNIVHGDEVAIALRVIELVVPAVEQGDSLRALLEAHPWLLEQSTIDAVERSANIVEGQASNVRALVTLLRDARSDVETAWGAYASYYESAARGLERFQPVLEKLWALVTARRFDDAITSGTAAIDDAERAGAPVIAGVLDAIVANALLQTQSGDHAGNVEAAVHHYNRAVQRATDDAEAGERLMGLAAAYGMRVLGDPRANSEEAVQALRSSERLLSNHGNSDLLALVQTNLAQALERRESGERLANLNEAYRLCRAALRWRSPERDAVDWAYTMVNLGNVVEKRADLGRGGVREASRAYEAVIARGDQISDRRILGVAFMNLGGVHRVKAVRTRLRRSRFRHLTQAEDALRQAQARLDGVDRLMYGRATSRLADVLELRGNQDGLLGAAREAAAVLVPTLAPDDAEHAAQRLGWLLAERGDWPGAAAAYADALAAADLRYYARMLPADRASELEDRANLDRWAAFALARDGQFKAAVLALEDGRMRELRRRLPPTEADLDRLQAVSPDLHRDLLVATSDLAHAELADDTDAAARRHHAVIERIRGLPGFESFAASVRWSTVTAAAEPSHPLVYVNPTPFGTLILTISHQTAENGASVGATFLDVTSTEIVQRLLFGLENRRQAGPSYILAVMAHGPAAISQALAFNLPWFGKELAAPLDADLRRARAHGATLVLAGPLALLPLHAAPWMENGAAVMLAERYAVSLTPSATAHAAALRAASARPPTGALVALGDPRGGIDALPAARAEVKRIAAQFPADNRAVALGPDATSRFLLAHAPGAAYLHLACHARGVAFDFRETSLQLADTDLPLTRLAGLGRLEARLAVISACQTGTADVVSASEEAYSIGAVLLAAGAACAIVSLWTVDDYATALLMTRLYEILDDEPGPARALRQAQHWLRTLTAEAHTAYVTARPELGMELARRGETHASEESHEPDGECRPFADPQYWAAFVAMGG
jgi:CHAT domain-containing protein